MKRIGFIGLGVMGRPMVGHLLRAGFSVQGFDVSAAALADFASAGGVATASVEEVVRGADVVFTMLPTATHAFEVYEAAGGAFDAATPEQILVDCSTLGVDAVLRLHASASGRGLRFLDVPVTGASPAAIAGTLVFIGGGDKEAVAEVTPILLKMGSKCIYAGKAGTGQAIKICNNMAAGVIKAAICEAFVLAEKLGVDPRTFFEVASQGSAQSFALNVLCPYPGILPNAPSTKGYEGGFATRLMHKDMLLACSAAAATGATIPVTTLAAKLFGECAEGGYADRDNAVLLQYLLGLSQAPTTSDRT